MLLGWRETWPSDVSESTHHPPSNANHDIVGHRPVKRCNMGRKRWFGHENQTKHRLSGIYMRLNNALALSIARDGGGKAKLGHGLIQTDNLGFVVAQPAH